MDAERSRPPGSSSGRPPPRDSAIAPPSGGASTEFQEVTTAIQFVDAVSTALRHRTKRLPPTPPVGQLMSSRYEASSPSLLAQLATSAQVLLSTHSLLELKSLPSDTTAAVCNDEIHKTSITVVSVAAQIERSLLDVQQRNVKSYVEANRSVFQELRKAVELIVHNSRAMVAVRAVVTSRDLTSAEELLTKLKDDATCTRTPLVVWMEQQWLPAMRKWNSIVQSTTRVASQSDSPLELARSVERAHSEVMTNSASIAEILLPGESVQQLLKRDIDDRVQHLAEELRHKQETMQRLREAVAKVDFFSLAQAIREAEKLALSTQEERSALKEAEGLLLEVQLVANTTVALSKAVKARTLVTLLRAVVAANEAIAQLKICGSERKCSQVVRRGRDILASLEAVVAAHPNGDDRLLCANTSFEAHELAIEHVPGRAWATELSLLYQRAVRDLSAIRERYELQNELGQLTQQLQANESSAKDKDGLDRLQLLLSRAKTAHLEGDEVSAGVALLASANELRLKVHFESSIRMIVVPERERLSFAFVMEALTRACVLSSPLPPAGSGGAQQALRVRYQDDDGDFVSVLNNDDWAILVRDVRAARASGGKIELYCDYPAVPSAQSSQRRPTTRDAVSSMTSPQGKGFAPTGKRDGRAGMASSSGDVGNQQQLGLFVGGVSLAKGGDVVLQPSSAKPFAASPTSPLQQQQQASSRSAPPPSGIDELPKRWDAPASEFELHTIASVSTELPRIHHPASAAGVRPGSNRGTPRHEPTGPAPVSGFAGDMLTTQHINLSERRRWVEGKGNPSLTDLDDDGRNPAEEVGDSNQFEIRTITSMDTAQDGPIGHSSSQAARAHPQQSTPAAKVDPRTAYIQQLRRQQPASFSGGGQGARIRGLLPNEATPPDDAALSKLVVTSTKRKP